MLPSACGQCAAKDEAAEGELVVLGVRAGEDDRVSAEERRLTPREVPQPTKGSETYCFLALALALSTNSCSIRAHTARWNASNVSGLSRSTLQILRSPK